RLAFISILFAILNFSECRVKFTHSSLYDENDFVGKTRIEIEECSNMRPCAIYVSILNDPNLNDVYSKLQMSSSEFRQENVTLIQLNALRNTTTMEIDPYLIPDGEDEESPGPTYFFNDNDEQISAPLVIYAVNLDNAPNYADTAVYDASSIGDGIVKGKIVTILSAHPFTTKIAGDEKTLGTIFATGFDNADPNDANPDKCRHVMSTRPDLGVVTFQINGPITTIYFSDFQGKLIDTKNTITASLQFSYDNLELYSRGFVTSQGYIGCDSKQIYSSSLYKDVSQYSLFTVKSQFVHQAVYVNTDSKRPVSVHTDNALQNFIGDNLLTPQDDCKETHKLEIAFNETTTNSFALVYYYYSDKNCDYELLTTSPKPVKSTTKKVESTSPKPVKSTTKKVESTSPKPIESTTTLKPADKSTTAPISDPSTTVGGSDSTTSSAFGFSMLPFSIAIVHRILL
ncbi:hypothetical protein PENTCL1PPCAC_13286, partial [Pristionchus entomophagus]